MSINTKCNRAVSQASWKTRRWTIACKVYDSSFVEWGGNSTFFGEVLYVIKNWKYKKLNNLKNTKNSYFLMSVASLYTACFVMFCVLLYGPFCHGAHKLDLSTLFSTFVLWTSLSYIFSFVEWINVNKCIAINVVSSIQEHILKSVK